MPPLCAYPDRQLADFFNTIRHERSCTSETYRANIYAETFLRTVAQATGNVVVTRSPPAPAFSTFNEPA